MEITGKMVYTRIMQPSLGIITAMASEANALFGRQTWRRYETGQKTCSVPLDGEGFQGRAICSGIGLQNAQMAADLLVSEGVSALASVGLCGGLEPALATGQIVVASGVMQIDSETRNGPRNAAGAGWADEILRSEGIAVRTGKIMTSTQAILTPDHKRELFRQSQAVVVDMESAAVARVAERAKIPFFGMRSVCDTANQAVPEDLLTCLDPHGSIRIAAVLRNLIRRPTLVKDMWRIGHCFSTARKALKHSWQVLVEKGVFADLMDSR